MSEKPEITAETTSHSLSVTTIYADGMPLYTKKVIADRQTVPVDEANIELDADEIKKSIQEEETHLHDLEVTEPNNLKIKGRLTGGFFVGLGLLAYVTKVPYLPEISTGLGVVADSYAEYFSRRPGYATRRNIQIRTGRIALLKSSLPENEVEVNA